MNKNPNKGGRSEPFPWSKISGKLNKGARSKGETYAWAKKVQKRKDSSSSSDKEEFALKVSSRQKELLKSAPKLFDKKASSKFRDFKDVSEERGWLKSARQRELIHTRSNSSLPGTEKEHPSSALQKLWPSTARQREKKEVSRGDWSGSAGSRELSVNDSNRDSAGSIKRNESGTDLLVEAVRFGRTRHIKLLLDGGTNPNILDHEGVTPLIAAVADVTDVVLRQRLMQLLFDAGADPNVGDYAGTTPLMHAASIDCHEAAVTLLQHEKTDAGQQNNEGFSALMFAASHGYSAIVLLILATFKKVHHVTYLGQRNCEGLTACDLAERNGHFDVSSLLRADIPIAPRPQGLCGFIPAAHELSRSPTPTDSFEFSDQESDRAEEDLPRDQTFRPPTPVTDFENFDSLSLTYDQDTTDFGVINKIGHSSSPGSGNEADTESLMDGDQQLLSESEKEFPLKTPYSMSSPVVKSANSSVGIPTPGASALPSSEANPQQSVRILSSSGNLLVDRSAIEKFKDVSYSVHASGPSKKDSTRVTSSLHTQSLNPLIKISIASPTKGMPIVVTEAMPKIGLSASNKSLNKSIKSLVHEDYEMRPVNRPPTPARPSLPTLLAGKQDFSPDSSLSSSSTEATERSRRVTLVGFPRSTSEPKALSVSPPQRTSQDEEEFATDVLDASTKSEGWDSLWGPRGRSSLLHSEGHVVPLPPIGHTRALHKSKMSKMVGHDGEESVLNVAKKTLERLESVLSPGDKTNRKSKSLHRSRTAQHLNMSS